HDGNKAITCNDKEALIRALPGEIDKGFRLVVQERVFFDSVYDEIPCYVYVDEEHRVRMGGTAIKEKIQPFPYGTATVLRISWHEELLDLAQQVAKALRWRGMLMIEFIRDKKDDRWKVIEVNGRPWLFVDFFRRSGLNYVGYLYEDLLGRREEWPDFKILTEAAVRDSPVHISLPTAFEPPELGPGASIEPSSVADYVSSIPGSKCLTYLDPDDPEPGYRELADMASTLGIGADALLAALRPTLSSY
ncbi:MAG: hypothetical protein KC416_09055, partial [Myxococcales bacterium]|nr:hypothetical protein [Myxococcales bacterium]